MYVLYTYIFLPSFGESKPGSHTTSPLLGQIPGQFTNGQIYSRCAYLDALVDVSMLQLHEASGDGRDVRLLVGECHATRAL